MKRPIPNGLLVAVEGIDGAGKTSVATLLAQWCGEKVLGCVISKEPTGNKWGEELRASARAGRLSLERELELFALDRKDHVEMSIRPALEEGDIVILDRYYYSTAAYQGARGGDFRDIIAHNETFAPRPDLLLVLNVDVDAGLQRIRMRGDKPNLFESKGALTRARNIFLQIAEQSPNAVLIDASGHLKDTFPKAFNAFLIAAMNKITAAGPIDPAMLDQTLMLFGEAPIAGCVDPSGKKLVSAS